MTPKTVIFIGPQGSGKGTQIELLSATLKADDPTREVVDIQTGRRFRALAARGEGFTERHLSETLDTGVLQPLFLSVVLWGDAMREKLNDTAHLLIDGFPRIVPEAVVLESALSFYQRRHILVINLEAPENVVRERMQKRARPDDTAESIEARLTWYQEETVPVISYYRKREDTQVVDIDGTQSVEDVHTRICEALGINT